MTKQKLTNHDRGYLTGVALNNAPTDCLINKMGEESAKKHVPGVPSAIENLWTMVANGALTVEPDSVSCNGWLQAMFGRCSLMDTCPLAKAGGVKVELPVVRK